VDIGTEQPPFVLEPVEDPVPRERPLSPVEPERVEATPEPVET
jgi:hypothetical protein